MDYSQLWHSFCTPVQHELIFRNIARLHALHESTLGQLRARAAVDSSDCIIGDTVRDHLSKLSPAIADYVMFRDCANLTIGDILDAHPVTFTTFLADLPAKYSCDVM